MRRILLTAAGWFCMGVTMDRVAIVVGTKPILDSGIAREIRVTAFLNNQRPDFSAASRKQAASRLIDQELIREEVRTGAYPIATTKETSQMLAQVKNGRFQSDAQYREALPRAGISAAEIEDRLSWQMTVLKFIEARFRPGVQVSDEDARKYFSEHVSQFKGTFEQSRDEVVDVIAGERVNQALDTWLDQKRKETKIQYLEKELQ